MELERNQIIAITIVVVLLILYYWFKSDDSLYGLWTPDEDFLGDSGLSQMALFIGDEVDCGLSYATYACYLYMENSEDSVIENSRFELSVSKTFGSDGQWYNVTFDEVDVIPEKCQMRVNFNEGLMTIIGDDDIVYAELYKDNILTAHAKQCEEDDD